MWTCLSFVKGATTHCDLEISMGSGILRPAFSQGTKSGHESVPSNVAAFEMSIPSQSISMLSQSGGAFDGTAPVDSQSIAILVAYDDTTVDDLRRRIVTSTGLQVGLTTVGFRVKARRSET